MTKPILKWVGGKTQILSDIFSYFPDEINNYYEPFLGGGSVLLELLDRISQGNIKLHGKIYVNDINSKLIFLYRTIQQNPEQFIETLKKLIDEYSSITGTVVNRNAQTKTEAITSKESYYYYIRYMYNSLSDKNDIQFPAMFLFLNKTGFRGLYRESSSGGFNVPYGHYKTDLCISEETIISFSNIIKSVVFESQNFDLFLKEDKLTIKDFIYFDPPYVKEKKSSFIGYNVENQFDDKTSEQLFNLCHRLKNKQVRFIMSNSDTETVQKAFHGYSIRTLSCKRRINSKNPESMTNEVIIYS